MMPKTTLRSLAEEINNVKRSIAERSGIELEKSAARCRREDALSASGHPGVTRHFPHTPGIDAAGEVVACSNAR